MKPKDNEPDEDCDCAASTGPQTCPIDLQSEDVELPNQNEKTYDGSNPKQDAMQDMINERVGKENFDETGGMKPENSPDRGWAR